MAKSRARDFQKSRHSHTQMDRMSYAHIRLSSNAIPVCQMIRTTRDRQSRKLLKQRYKKLQTPATCPRQIVGKHQVHRHHRMNRMNRNRKIIETQVLQMKVSRKRSCSIHNNKILQCPVSRVKCRSVPLTLLPPQ